MTQLLEQALAVAKTLPPAMQDEIARTIIALACPDDEQPIDLAADELAAIAASKAEAERGEFASDADVRAVWSKYGL